MGAEKFSLRHHAAGVQMGKPPTPSASGRWMYGGYSNGGILRLRRPVGAQKLAKRYQGVASLYYQQQQQQQHHDALENVGYAKSAVVLMRSNAICHVYGSLCCDGISPGSFAARLSRERAWGGKRLGPSTRARGSTLSQRRARVL